jgi:hypothetical protein
LFSPEYGFKPTRFFFLILFATTCLNSIKLKKEKKMKTFLFAIALLSGLPAAHAYSCSSANQLLARCNLVELKKGNETVNLPIAVEAIFCKDEQDEKTLNAYLIIQGEQSEPEVLRKSTTSPVVYKNEYISLTLNNQEDGFGTAVVDLTQLDTKMIFSCMY